MAEGRVLLVEDNADDEALILRAFRRTALPHDIVVTHDGAEALEFLFGSTTGESPSDVELPMVMFLDLKLPKLSGLDVLRRVRAQERTRSLPVVILTSSKEQEDIERCYELGANSYVNKPVDFTKFAEAVQDMGKYWLMLNEPPLPTLR